MAIKFEIGVFEGITAMFVLIFVVTLGIIFVGLTVRGDLEIGLLGGAAVCDTRGNIGLFIMVLIQLFFIGIYIYIMYYLETSEGDTFNERVTQEPTLGMNRITSLIISVILLSIMSILLVFFLRSNMILVGTSRVCKFDVDPAFLYPLIGIIEILILTWLVADLYIFKDNNDKTQMENITGDPGFTVDVDVGTPEIKASA